MFSYNLENQFNMNYFVVVSFSEDKCNYKVI